MAQPTPAETLALLNRLASKPGVQSTLILSRSDGSVIRTSGLDLQQSAPSLSATSQASVNGGSSLSGPADASTSTGENSNMYEDRIGGSGASKGAEQMARMVWSFVEAAGGLVAGLDAEDEVKLLRLRTKKQELVIVPDSKFLLVVIHETARA